jgi:23S rRNA U2552 (ribose-2'-O)-methylase RlmE/FtsJ
MFYNKKKTTSNNTSNDSEIYDNFRNISIKLEPTGNIVFDFTHKLDNFLQNEELLVENEKLKFDKIPITSTYEEARRLYNPFEDLRSGVFINRSALKMLELNNIYELYNKNTKLVLDVCSAPGGFSECILLSNKWATDVVGSSLKHKGTAFGTVKFNKSSPTESYVIYNGESGNGDITDSKTINDITNYIHKKYYTGADLVCGDGVFIFKDYTDENASKEVFHGEALAAIKNLKIGGNFVVKLLLPFSKYSYHLVYFLNSLFGESFISKPITSRPASSEVFFVGKKFIGLKTDDLKIFETALPFICSNSFVIHEKNAIENKHRSLVIRDEYAKYLKNKDNITRVLGFIKEDKSYDEYFVSLQVGLRKIYETQYFQLSNILNYVNKKAADPNAVIRSKINHHQKRNLIEMFYKENKMYNVNSLTNIKYDKSLVHYELDYSNKITDIMFMDYIDTYNNKLVNKQPTHYLYKNESDVKICENKNGVLSSSVVLSDVTGIYKYIPTNVILAVYKHNDTSFDFSVVYSEKIVNDLINYSDILTEQRLKELVKQYYLDKSFSVIKP